MLWVWWRYTRGHACCGMNYGRYTSHLESYVTEREGATLGLYARPKNRTGEKRFKVSRYIGDIKTHFWSCSYNFLGVHGDR